GRTAVDSESVALSRGSCPSVSIHSSMTLVRDMSRVVIWRTSPSAATTHTHRWWCGKELVRHESDWRQPRVWTQRHTPVGSESPERVSDQEGSFFTAGRCSQSGERRLVRCRAG